MSAPSLNTCSPWATVDELCNPCLDNYDNLDSAQIERFLQISSNLLYILSGRQFPGLCEATVRPCGKHVWDNPPRRYISSTPAGMGCGCSSRVQCGCPTPSQISLGVYPIHEILEVKVDGEVLTPAQYQVDDYRFLTRLPDDDGTFNSWPCCPNVLLADTEEDTFSVTFTYGYEPPEEAVTAASILACEMYLACNPIDGAECRLPKRVQSLTRQGVSMVMIDPQEFLAAGRLGIMEVDAFIIAHNPRNRRRNSGVYSPDIGPRTRRTNTAPAGFGGGGYGQ